jgi:hypothetical protein
MIKRLTFSLLVSYFLIMSLHLIQQEATDKPNS